MPAASVTNEVAESWEDMRIDNRVLEGVKKLKWNTPTLVQKACIPQALKGRDVAVQARTGTGKTGAFLLPIIQRILNERDVAKKAGKKGNKGVTTSTGDGIIPLCAIILVPSVELAQQTAEAAKALIKFIKPRIVVEDLCSKSVPSDSTMRAADIVVVTATLLAKAIKSSHVTSASLSFLRVLVIDEADYLFDIASTSMLTVQSSLAAQTKQVLLFSATLTDGVATMKGQMQNSTNITLTSEDVDVNGNIITGKKASKRERNGEADVDETNPIIESHIAVKDTEANRLKQRYLVSSDDCHPHTLLFGLYRLKLIDGKTLIFVNDEDDTYEIQSFLEQLGIVAAVYDTHLPVNVRVDTLKKFQSGEVATLLCTDSTLERASSDIASATGDGTKPPKKFARKEKGRSSGESDTSALHRGIDFSDVKNVIIFDGIEHPNALSFNKYTHRVGRAGRAGKEGTSILILRVPQARKVLQPLKDFLKSQRNENLKPFKKMIRSEAAKMQYRVDTVLSNVTRTATRRLRVATVASELARSNFLSTHLGDSDTSALKRVIGRSKRHVKSDKTLLELPQYMNLSKVDSAKEFKERVNSQKGLRKEEVFNKVTRRAVVDPIKAVVNKVRLDTAAAKREERRSKINGKKKH
eukprot:Tbor_TRINITY_DN9911_c0_g1::TRINITY_DN9911_c0_g1_i1::g.17651::m.17651/K14810/DDX56, DBP9; ATP-dependent RNA helicase DDX56/DBP9